MKGIVNLKLSFLITLLLCMGMVLPVNHAQSFSTPASVEYSKPSDFIVEVGYGKPKTNRKGKRKAASVRGFVMKQIKMSGLERKSLFELKKEMKQAQSKARSHFKYLKESLVSHEGKHGQPGQGHTIVKHVGLSIKGLRDRYLAETVNGPSHINNFSTFKSLKQAEHLIERVIHEKMKTPEGRKEMKDLVEGKADKNRLEWRHNFKEVTGQSFHGPSGQVSNTTAVKVRLLRDPNRRNGWRVVTAYPLKKEAL